ncbi:hypothetical protein D9M72_533920 [compost metagenome]
MADQRDGMPGQDLQRQRVQQVAPIDRKAHIMERQNGLVAGDGWSFSRVVLHLFVPGRIAGPAVRLIDRYH